MACHWGGGFTLQPGAQNCTEHLIQEESLLQHLERGNYLPGNWQDASVYAIHKYNSTFIVTRYG